MFQIEPILWLQSFESPGLTWMMSTVSSLGYSSVYGLLIICIIFGLHLKKGLVVFLAMVICGILTHGLKSGLKFPRPSDIDIRIIEPDRDPSPHLVEMGGAQSFWALPSSEAMAATKRQPEWSYGFPSGHVSAAAVFFISLAFFLNWRAMYVFSGIWIILMALSRLYLGRHFIADVLAGVGVGVLAIILISFFVRSINPEKFTKWDPRIHLPLILFITLSVILASFVEQVDDKNVGRLLGVFLAYIVAFKIQSDKGTVWMRLGRIIIAISLFALADQLINLFMASAGWEEWPFGMLISAFLITGIPLISTIIISHRFNLYRKEELSTV